MLQQKVAFLLDRIVDARRSFHKDTAQILLDLQTVRLSTQNRCRLVSEIRWILLARCDEPGEQRIYNIVYDCHCLALSMVQIYHLGFFCFSYSSKALTKTVPAKLLSERFSEAAHASNAL